MELNIKKSSLEEILSHKTMYYDKIDFSIVEKSWQILSKFIKIPYLIHIVGTNGKGSTGRLLSHYLVKNGYKTLHYSSPHILKFNERIWINGRDSLDFELNFANKKLQHYLTTPLLEKLTYFEYTTLLSLVLSDGLDFLVFEAGLGGEFDATNVVPSQQTLVTTIDLDHQDFLGDSIEKIAKTKMRSADNKILIGYQIHNEVYSTAVKVKEELKKEFDRDIEIISVKEFDKYRLNKKFPEFINRNLALVVASLKQLNIKIDLSLFEDIKLFGRCQKIASNITIDVGHNPLAAKVLVKEFEEKKVHLIYNSYKDKDYKSVLEILKPIISKLTICKIVNKRIADENNLLEICKNLNIIVSTYDSIKADEEYLVFGSFSVVEKFLKNMSVDER
ncbi:bifunctional folylpolyglutamate synthase/dihydrofolate synthase [Halarcobacter ebronensis]|uniref:Bifunctional folylpolyglutamate synthase/dihydrofolate synthase n=1 Tax=Halarcobacter ebronensis TaxID=1462615 RepID=A0A4Q0YH57_9BACT|nr:bifunctional folylpolyglutamate synthase/dihydrofolate synthase [Halarcobacter ebronensis]